MGNIAILFPGQGSQYIGMGKKIYANFPLARRIFEEASDTLHLDMSKMCFEGSNEELAKTENTQPAILTVSVAAFKVFADQTGIKPAYLAGHSLGEITALACANTIKFADAVKLVKLRGKYMQEATPPGSGLMTAVNGVDSTLVKQECDKISKKDHIAVVSNYNSALQTVVSGNRKAVELIGKLLSEKGAKVIPLNVSAPFHSPLMKPAAERLYEYLSALSYNKFKYPVLSNITASPYTSEDFIPSMLTSQMLRPVQWVKSMKFLQLQDIDTFIDIGPGDTLKSLVERDSGNHTILSFEKDEEFVYELTQEKNTEASASSKVEKELKFVEQCLAIATCTPNNSNTGEHQEKAASHYKRIKQLLIHLTAERLVPDKEQMKDSLNMLHTVFRVKNTPMEEQRKRLAGLFREAGTTDLFMTLADDNH